MYNEEQKMRFVRETYHNTSRATSAISIMKAIEPYETKLGMDICTMGKEDATKTMESVIGFRSEGVRAYINILRDYFKWCVANNIQGATLASVDMQPSSVVSMKKRTVRNPLHLSNFMDAVFFEPGKGYYDDIYRCFLWMAYGGIPADLVDQIQIQDVDFSDMVIRHGEQEATIYREALPVFRSCAEGNAFYRIRRSTQTLAPRFASNQLLRGFMANASYTMLMTECTRKVSAAVKDGKTNLKLSYSRVFLSGLFYRTYEMEMAGVLIDFSAGAKLLLTPDERMDYNKVHRATTFFKKDYNIWKETF